MRLFATATWFALLLGVTACEGGNADDCGACGPFQSCVDGSCSNPATVGAECDLEAGPDSCNNLLVCANQYGEGVCVEQGDEGTPCSGQLSCDVPGACVEGICVHGFERRFEPCFVSYTWESPDGPGIQFSSCAALYHGPEPGEQERTYVAGYLAVLLMSDASGSVASPPPGSLRLVMGLDAHVLPATITQSSEVTGAPPLSDVFATFTDEDGNESDVSGTITTDGQSDFGAGDLDQEISFGVGTITVETPDGPIVLRGTLGVTSERPEGTGGSSCFDDTNGICTEITSYEGGTATPDDFMTMCEGTDDADHLDMTCEEIAEQEGLTLVMLCDGTRFDIEGEPVQGKAYFYASDLTPDQMDAACRSANGTPMPSEGGTTLPPKVIHVVCPSGVESDITLPPGTEMCQMVYDRYARACACNQVDTCMSLQSAYETCAAAET